jgi:SAM-dependent methyltransferase
MEDRGRKLNSYSHEESWEKNHTSSRAIASPAQGLIRIMKGTYPSLPIMPNEGRALDLGCGDGRNTLFLKSLGFQCYGVEITDAIVNQLHNSIPDCTFKTGSNANIPFPDEFFDLIVSWNAIYYMGDDRNRDLRQNLSECFRKLKKNGKSSFIISIPCPSSFIFDKSEISREQDGIEYRIIRNDPFNIRNGEMLATFNNAAALIRILKQIGFNEVVVGEEFGNWFGFQYDWWVAICKI